MSNFRNFKANKKLKGAINNSEFVEFGAGDIGKSSLDCSLKHARKSGSLNLANRNLNIIPKEVFEINRVPSKDDNSVSFDEHKSGWWENVFLSKLILVANNISVVEKDIVLLDKLTYLDLSDNKIEKLPNEICELVQLRHLNISKNMTSLLPGDINRLKMLQQLLCGHNKIKNVPDLSSMGDLEWLDISYNNLSEFPPSIVSMISLKRLDLSHNLIPSMSCCLDQHPALRFIDLSHNKLECFASGINAHVEQLYLHVNRLSAFPISHLQSDLKELSVTHNQIKALTESDITNIPNLSTLAIANNLITELPANICNLRMLANLDVSNNELRKLPFSLGTMDTLKSISIEGNPFRAMKRTLLGAGAEVIKEYLRVRNTEPDDKASDVGHGIQGLTIDKSILHLDQADIRATGVVRLSSFGLTVVPDEIFTSLQNFQVKEVMLNKNRLSSFPMRVLDFQNTIVDLDVSNNQLVDLPNSIDCLRHLQRLNLSNNQILSLPPTITTLKSLIFLAVSYNSLGSNIPDVIYGCHNLQTLHMCHCDLHILDAEKIRSLKHLEILDVSNNDISAIPAELGLCDNIKSLILDGNSFKVPRLTLLAKGTAAVMEYLKSRIIPEK